MHALLESGCKPKRPDELSRSLKDASEDGLGLLYKNTSERFKDESGEWKSRRVLRLSLQKNGVTA